MTFLEQLLISGAVWGVIAAGVGAFIAQWLSRRTKISEFRQAWIDDLRQDIADYVGASQRWFRKWEELNELDGLDSSPKRGIREPKELFPIANEAMIILWRIRLRLNPRENRYKTQDDQFLACLDDLLNPGKFAPEPRTRWLQLANDAVEKGREILKREWEVTKGKRG
jgi:hypothetical protein